MASYKNWLVKLPEKDYRQHPSLLASLSCDAGWAIHIYPFSNECFKEWHKDRRFSESYYRVLVEGRYGKEEASFSFSCQRGKAAQGK